MPAIDQCEPAVIRALQKAGWIVTHQPYSIHIVEPGRSNYVYADLRLRHSRNSRTIIVTEVKCFADKRQLMDDLYESIGQYATYRSALALENLQLPLYLAIPLAVYATFFQKPLVQRVINDVQVKLVIVDTEKEEIIQWIS
jgi:hypothetical protein